MAENEKDPMVRLGGLWRAETRGGQQMLRGRLGAAKILVFENSYKRDENDPDMVMYLAAGKPREDSDGSSGGGGGGASSSSGSPGQNDPGTEGVDDIPF
jgi:hypothetical protein